MTNATLTAASTETLAARAAARLEIEEALANFTHGSDKRDPELWLSAFHDDAVLDVDSGQSVLTGHDEILAGRESCGDCRRPPT